MPTRLLLELVDVALSVLGVSVCGQAHGEERGREPLEYDEVLPHVVVRGFVVLAHVDGGTDDHPVVSARYGIPRRLDVHRKCVVTIGPNHVDEMLRDFCCLSFGSTDS